MREPNFSESQLQQATNTAFIRRVVELHGVWAFAHVPSLIAEFDLGWDTAFFLPWLPYVPSVDDEGCNFFIQYKLSGELTSAGAKEWPAWNTSYLRFKIPHSTRTRSGSFIDDYHQWDRLKFLADRGYPTFYATNSTLHKEDLQNQLSMGTLLDQIPLLDVRTITGQHKHVTFTRTSSSFALHSEKREVNKLAFSQGLSLIARSEQSTLRNSVERLIASLRELPSNDDRWNQDLARLYDQRDSAARSGPREWRQYLQLTYFARQHLGADLLWLPKDA